MNTQRPVLSTCTAAIVAACMLVEAASFADETTSDPNAGSATPAPPPIQFQVLQTRRINLGDHSLIMNRVVPPVLPAPPPAAPPSPPSALTEEARQAFLQRPRKKSVVLFLSATVYDHQISQVSWQDANGFYRAFSNIDFTPIPFGLGFETADTRYSFMVLSRNTTRAAAEAHQRDGIEHWIPQLSDFNNTQSGYIVVEDPAKPVSDEACAPLDALHVYFDANKQAILDNFATREAARIAREQWLKDHPPVPKDTVINYWRKPDELPTPGQNQ